MTTTNASLVTLYIKNFFNLLDMIRDMIRGGGDAKLIAEVIHEKAGKVMLPKQVHNVKHKFQSIDVGNHTED